MEGKMGGLLQAPLLKYLINIKSYQKSKNKVLISAGCWGKSHLRNLAELGVFHSVFDVKETERFI